MTTTDQCCLDVFQNTSIRNAQTENYTEDTHLSSLQTTDSITSGSSSLTDSSINSIQSAYKINYDNDNGNKYHMSEPNNSTKPLNQPADILTLMPQTQIKESMSDCCNAYRHERKYMLQLQQQLQEQQQQLQQKLQQQHAQRTQTMQQPYHEKLSALKSQKSHYQLQLQQTPEINNQKFLFDGSMSSLEYEYSEIFSTPSTTISRVFVDKRNGDFTQANQRIRSALTNFNTSPFQFNISAALKHYISFCRDEFNAALSSTLKCRTLARGISRTLDLLQETSSYFNNINEYMYCVCELVAIYTSSELIYAREFKDHKLQIADRILFIAHRFLTAENEELTRANFLRMFTKIKKMYGEREIMTTLFRDFIPEEMVKNGQKELPDKMYIQYIIIFYQWKELELTDGDQKNVIDFADSFMRPAYSLYYNGCYAQFLPQYKSYAHATRFILEHLRFFEDLRIASILDNRLGSDLDELDLYDDELKLTAIEPSNCNGANFPKTHSTVSLVDSTIDDDSNDSCETKTLSNNRLQKLKKNAQYCSNEVAMRKYVDTDSGEEEVNMPYRINAGNCESLPMNEIEQHRPYNEKCNMNRPLESYDSQYRNKDSIQHQQQQQYYPTSYKQQSQHEINNYHITQNANDLKNTEAMQLNPEDEEYLHDLEDALNYNVEQTPALLMTVPDVAKTGEYHDCPLFQTDDSYDDENKYDKKVLDSKLSLKRGRKSSLFEETVKKDEKKLNTTHKNDQQLVGPSQQKSTVKRIRKKSIDMVHTQLKIAEDSLKCSTDNTTRKETLTKINKRVKFNEKPLGPTRSMNTTSGMPLKPALSSSKIKQNRFHKTTMRNVNKETKSLSDLRYQSHSDSNRNIVNNNKAVKSHKTSTSISTISAISTSSSCTTHTNEEIENSNESLVHVCLQATPGCHNLNDARLLKQSKKSSSYNELTCLRNESAFVNRILERKRDEMRRKRLAMENQQNKLHVKSKLSSAMSLIIHKADTKCEPIKNIQSKAAVNMANNATQTLTKKSSSYASSGPAIRSNSYASSGAAIRNSSFTVSKPNIPASFKCNVKSSVSTTSSKLMKSATKSTPNMTRKHSYTITKKQMKTEQKNSKPIVPLQQTLQELLEEQRKFEEHKQWLQQRRQSNKVKPKVKVCEVMCTNQGVRIPYTALTRSATVTPQASFIMPSQEFGVKPFQIQHKRLKSGSAANSSERIDDIFNKNKTNEFTINAISMLPVIQNTDVDNSENVQTTPILPFTIENICFDTNLKIKSSKKHKHKKLVNKNRMSTSRKAGAQRFVVVPHGKRNLIKTLQSKSKYRIHRRYATRSQTKRIKKKSKTKIKQLPTTPTRSKVIKENDNTEKAVQTVVTDYKIKEEPFNLTKKRDVGVGGNVSRVFSTTSSHGKSRRLSADEIQNVIESSKKLKNPILDSSTSNNKDIQPTNQNRSSFSLLPKTLSNLQETCDSYRKNHIISDEKNLTNEASNTEMIKIGYVTVPKSMAKINTIKNDPRKAKAAVTAVQQQAEQQQISQNNKITTAPMNLSLKKIGSTDISANSASSFNASSEYSITDKENVKNITNKTKQYSSNSQPADKSEQQENAKMIKLQSTILNNSLDRRQRRKHKIESYDDRSTSELSIKTCRESLHRHSMDALKTRYPIISCGTSTNDSNGDNSPYPKNPKSNTTYPTRSPMKRCDKPKEVILLKAPAAHSLRNSQASQNLAHNMNHMTTFGDESSEILSINRSKIQTKVEIEFSKINNYSKERMGRNYVPNVFGTNMKTDVHRDDEMHSQRFTMKRNGDGAIGGCFIGISRKRSNHLMPKQSHMDFKQTNRSIYSLAQSVKLPSNIDERRRRPYT